MEFSRSSQFISERNSYGNRIIKYEKKAALPIFFNLCDILLHIHMNIIEELKKVFYGEISSDTLSLQKYSRDASLFEIQPSLIVAPQDVEDVKHVVRFVADQKQSNPTLSLTARSGGTDMTGGPLTESIVVDFTKHFNQIKNFGLDFGIVQPGVYYRDFEKASLAQDLLMPSYPASREICTVGGMVSNNSGGEKTLAYGKTEDYVQELKVVFSDGNEYIVKPLSKPELDGKMKQNNFEGEVYRKLFTLISRNYDLIQNAKPRVTKNSAGYYLWNVWDGTTFNLAKLIVGSQGTLGLVTEIKFRLIHPKKRSQMVVIFLRNLKPLATIAKMVMEFHPESFESYDDNTLKLAIRFLPSLIKILKPKNLLKLGWQFLPEMKMVLTGGLPKLVMLAEFTADTDQEIADKLQSLQPKLKALEVQFRIVPDPEEAKKYWTIRRESFNLLRTHIKGKRTAPFIDDFIVRVEQLSEFLPRLNAILGKYDLTYTIAGHVGDANFHIIPLMSLDMQKSKVIIDSLSHEVYDLVLEFHGSITAEHNDGLIRTPYLEKMYGEKIYLLFEETKRIFDPQNIFNPGKKVKGNLQYSFDHLVKS